MALAARRETEEPCGPQSSISRAVPCPAGRSRCNLRRSWWDRQEGAANLLLPPAAFAAPFGSAIRAGAFPAALWRDRQPLSGLHTAISDSACRTRLRPAEARRTFPTAFAGRPSVTHPRRPALAEVWRTQAARLDMNVVTLGNDFYSRSKIGCELRWSCTDIIRRISGQVVAVRDAPDQGIALCRAVTARHVPWSPQ